MLPDCLFFIYFAASLPVKNPPNVAISQTFLNTLEVVSTIGLNTLAPGLKMTTSMGAIFSSTSLNKLTIESSSRASTPKPLAHPPDSFISFASSLVFSMLPGLLTGHTL